MSELLVYVPNVSKFAVKTETDAPHTYEVQFGIAASINTAVLISAARNCLREYRIYSCLSCICVLELNTEDYGCDLYKKRSRRKPGGRVSWFIKIFTD